LDDVRGVELALEPRVDLEPRQEQQVLAVAPRGPPPVVGAGRHRSPLSRRDGAARDPQRGPPKKSSDGADRAGGGLVRLVLGRAAQPRTHPAPPADSKEEAAPGGLSRPAVPSRAARRLFRAASSLRSRSAKIAVSFPAILSAGVT